MTCCHNTRNQNSPAQRTTLPTPTPVPSPVILSFLATLPQHSERRINLDFLLPPSPTSHPSSSSPAIPAQPTADPAHPSTRRSRGGASRAMPFIPPKWVQDSDGIWYPATAWTLHGRHQTSSASDASLPSPTKLSPHSGDLIRPAADDATAVGNGNGNGNGDGNYSSSGSPIIAEYNDIEASLPTGWSPKPPRTKFYDVPVIVVVSMILAIVVTLVITGCVLGRKTGADKKRSKRRQHNISQEEKDLESEGEGENLARMKKMKKRKAKMWEMWRRQGAKIGLRRREKKSTVAASSRDIGVDDDERTLRLSFTSVRTVVSDALRTVQVEPCSMSGGAITQDPPPTTTPEITPAPQTSITPSIPASTSSPLLASTSSNSPPVPSASLSPPTTPSLPPAYRRSKPTHKSTSTRVSHNVSPSPSDVSISMEMSESGDGDNMDDHNPDAQLLHAHIATDDKATLEKMRRAASAPSLHHQGAGLPHETRLDDGVEAVVPEWVDERVEDFDGISSPVSPSSHIQSQQCDSGPAHQQRSHPLLPPPPPGTHLHRHLDVASADELEGDGALPHYVPRFWGQLLSMGGSTSTIEDAPLAGSEFEKSDDAIVSEPSCPSAPSEPPLDLRPSAPPVELENDNIGMNERLDAHMGMDARPSAPPMPMEDEDEEDD